MEKGKIVSEEIDKAIKELLEENIIEVGVIREYYIDRDGRLQDREKE